MEFIVCRFGSVYFSMPFRVNLFPESGIVLKPKSETGFAILTAERLSSTFFYVPTLKRTRDKQVNTIGNSEKKVYAWTKQ